MAVDVESRTYQQAIADGVGRSAAEIELRVLQIMVARLKAVAEGQGIGAAYAAMLADMAEIRRLLGTGANTVFIGAQRALQTLADDNDGWALEYYEAAGVKQVPAMEDAVMAAQVARGAREVAEQAVKEFDTSALRIVDAGGTAHPLAERYRRLVTEVATRAAMGEQTREQAVRAAVSELANSGCRVQYASGMTRELYSAVRANVSKVARETAQGLREEQGRQFGADGVRVSSHPNCAPDHAPYQGKTYTIAEFEALQSRLDRKIGEHNCRHRTTPVLVGVRVGDSDAAERYRRESEKKVEITGLNGKKRTMTRYEATQYQRQVETRMRKLDMRRELCKTAGLDEDAKRASAERRALREYYRKLCADAGVPEMMERTRWPGKANR